LSVATIEGVVLFHSALGITFASHPSIKATQLLVVPKSIHIILAIFFLVIFKIYLKGIKNFSLSQLIYHKNKFCQNFFSTFL
jgi:hypothetical protein